MSDLANPQFWFAALQIVWINILLSADNAVVIAMACRGLKPRERRWGMIIGAGVATALLIIFASAVTALIQLPYLRILGGGALLWIAVNLVGQPEEPHAIAAASLRRAVWVIVTADFVMSLDNAVAAAALARGRYALIGLSLAVSIPIVYGGSVIMIALIRRFPIVVWVGGALLGFVAGEMFADDPVLSLWLRPAVDSHVAPVLPEAARHLLDRFGLDLASLVLGLFGACMVVVAGAIMWSRHRPQS
jgi:YjbE family integral membrane protein